MKFATPNLIGDLFHLSDTNHNGEWFIPRVPQSRMHNEDSKQDRVCFAPTIEEAWRAIVGYERPYDYRFVHIPGNIDELLRLSAVAFPDGNEVPDVLETNEVWCLDTVEMICIGLAELWIEHNPYTKQIEIKWAIIDHNPPDNVWVDNDGEYRYSTGPHVNEWVDDTINDELFASDPFVL